MVAGDRLRSGCLVRGTGDIDGEGGLYERENWGGGKEGQEGEEGEENVRGFWGILLRYTDGGGHFQ